MKYDLIFQDEIKNIGQGYIYNHKKTDAKIVYIKNQDKNKVFSIAFRTLPKDSTGIQHIIEHCVLAGSKKYNLKDPFKQLDKCTLNTYLNAITFSDKTLYPVASMNNKDFFKLVDVYLDAVFFPLIYEKEGIFLQEGWHFNGEEINGVVYNEMKGVYSSPSELMDYKVKQNIFCDGYGFDSGGYPDEIPNLTYEQFLKFHKEYYTPTNSIIYLYGDLDIDYYLNYIDNEYLNKFEKGIVHKINKSENKIENKYIQCSYFLENDDLQSKNYLQATYKLNFSLQQEKNTAFEVISNILTENQEGILKKALLKEGICTNVYSYIDDDMIEPIFTIQIEGTDENDIHKFKAIIEDVVKNIKIDENLIESNFAPIEFYLKEGDFGYKPKGLFYNILLLKDMIYNKFDFSILKFDELIKKSKMINLENLLKDNIIGNGNYTYCILNPTNEKQKKPQIYFEKNTKQLIKYQSQQDIPEEIAKIPPLTIDDIEKGVFEINYSYNKLDMILEKFSDKKDLTKLDLEKFSNVRVIYNDINTEIVYINLCFDITDFGINRYITLFCYLFDKVGTKSIDNETLESKLNYLFGQYSLQNFCYDTKEEYISMLAFCSRILEKNLEETILLINTIFRELKFDDKQKIKNLLKEFVNNLDLKYLNGSKNIAIKRAKSYIKEKYLYQEEMTGIKFYKWVKSLDLENDIENIIENINDVKEMIYNEKRLLLSICGTNQNYKKALNCIKHFNFFDYKKPDFLKIKPEIDKNEAFVVSSDVNYNVLVSDLSKFGFKYEGQIHLLKNILNSEYIWEKIRTEGGAYGGEFSITEDGILSLISYSDPNIKKTYNNFYNLVDYIKNLDMNEETLHMYKIGALNCFEREPKNFEITLKLVSRYFKGTTNEHILREKNQILSANLDDIKKYADILKNGLKNSFICTMGNSEDIQKDIKIFDKIKKLL